MICVLFWIVNHFFPINLQCISQVTPLIVWYCFLLYNDSKYFLFYSILHKVVVSSPSSHGPRPLWNRQLCQLPAGFSDPWCLQDGGLLSGHWWGRQGACAGYVQSFCVAATTHCEACGAHTYGFYVFFVIQAPWCMEYVTVPFPKSSSWRTRKWQVIPLQWI